MITITRFLDYDYGHRVLGHEGKCRHLHGHRGRAEVSIRAPELDGIGRVIDFGVVKQVVGKWLDEKWDHQLLLNANDPQLEHFWATEPSPPYVMKYGNPTAENMARELAEVAVELLPPIMKVVRVRVWETPNCYADWEVDE